MPPLHDLSAVELLALYRSHQLSPVEYLDQLIAHIERWDPQLCALDAVDPQRALGR